MNASLYLLNATVYPEREYKHNRNWREAQWLITDVLPTHIIDSAEQIGRLSHPGHLNRCNLDSVLQPLCSTDQRGCTPHWQALAVTQTEVPAVFRARQAVGALRKLMGKSPWRMNTYVPPTQWPNTFIKLLLCTCVALDGSNVGVFVSQAASISESGVPFLVHVDILWPKQCSIYTKSVTCWM